jgi:hypothetical protein
VVGIYEVTWGPRLGKKVRGLAAALKFARDQAQTVGSGVVPAVWEDGGKVVAVVTDDADGLTVHRLIPEAWVEEDDKAVWCQFDAKPPLDADK